MPVSSEIQEYNANFTETLMNLKIGESMFIDEHMEIWMRRVPNGWVYTDRVSQNICFVPERIATQFITPSAI